VKVRVECYAGYQGDQEPRAFHLGGERRTVAQIAARWREPEADLFRVRADDGHTYLLRRDRETGTWELVDSRRADA
jgi:hypothetical protein